MYMHSSQPVEHWNGLVELEMDLERLTDLERLWWGSEGQVDGAQPLRSFT